MYFRLQGTALGLWLDEGSDLKIKLEVGESPGEVAFLAADPEEVDDDDWLFCHVRLVVQPKLPDSLTKFFEELAAGRVPRDLKAINEWEIYEPTQDPYAYRGFYEMRRVSPGTKGATPPLDSMPPEVQSFFELTQHDSGVRLSDSVNLLRWRTGLRGPHNALRIELASWSVDAKTWTPVPRDHQFHLRFDRDFDLTQSVVEDVSALGSVGATEPFAHQLFREAWQLRTANPRSSVLLAIAAVEVGLKHCVSALVPDASYLIEKLLLPPVPDLLKNYLPTLPAKLTLNGSVLAPPSDIRKKIDLGIQTRNKIAHRPAGGRELGEELSDSAVTSLLDAVSDVLWLLDYYCGHEWAIS